MIFFARLFQEERDRPVPVDSINAPRVIVLAFPVLENILPGRKPK
jgi:hypothetical protein